MAKLNVLQNEISIISVDGQDYISLTDMANARTDDARAADVIKNWIRNRYTIELLGTWEIIHNPDFKVVEFDHFKSQAGLPSFVMSVSDWVEKTNAIGLVGFVKVVMVVHTLCGIWHLSSALQSALPSSFI